jgi:hypothetical protein
MLSPFKTLLASMVFLSLAPCLVWGQNQRSAPYPSVFYVQTVENQEPDPKTKQDKGPDLGPKKGKDAPPAPKQAEPAPAPPAEPEVQEQPERGGNLGLGSFDDRFSGRAVPVSFSPPSIVTSMTTTVIPPFGPSSSVSTTPSSSGAIIPFPAPSILSPSQTSTTTTSVISTSNNSFTNTTVVNQVTTFSPSTVSFSVPLPGSGGVVGLEKVSENNSPLPRDRFIFDYSFYSNTVVAPGGYDVNRFVVGFEKTFLDSRASVEMRLPFAATLDSTQVATGLTNGATEIGDLHVGFKYLFYSSRTLNLSAGLALDLPTASNEVVRSPNGVTLIRIDNDSTIVTPYLAAMYTPNERMFALAWLEVATDPSGSAVYAFTPDLNGALTNVGRTYAQTVLELDAQIGYWVIQPGESTGVVTGLAPFVELHYNQSLNSGTLPLPTAFGGAASITHFSEVNFAAGVNTVFSNRLNMMLGIVVPLSSGDSKFFDYEIGLRFNWLF